MTKPSIAKVTITGCGDGPDGDRREAARDAVIACAQVEGMDRGTGIGWGIGWGTGNRVTPDEILKGSGVGGCRCDGGGGIGVYG